MGNMLILAATTKKSSPNLLPILIIVVLFVLLYMTMIRPQRNRQRNAQQMQSTVTPGSRVRTTAGIYGTVISVEDGDVVIEVAPGVNIRMLRRAVMEVVPDGTDTGMQDGAATAPPAEPPSENSHADDSHASDLDPQDRNI